MRSIGVLSGNSGLGSIRSRSVIASIRETQLLVNGRQSYNRPLTLTLQLGPEQTAWLGRINWLARAAQQKTTRRLWNKIGCRAMITGAS